jgi:hypothetical protein
LLELLDRNGSDFTIAEALMEQGLIRRSDYQGKKFFIRNFNIQE